MLTSSQVASDVLANLRMDGRRAQEVAIKLWRKKVNSCCEKTGGVFRGGKTYKMPTLNMATRPSFLLNGTRTVHNNGIGRTMISKSCEMFIPAPA